MADQRVEELFYIRPLVLTLFRKDTLEDDDQAIDAIDRLLPGTKLELLYQMAAGEWKFGNEGIEFARRLLERPGLIPDRVGELPDDHDRHRFQALLRARESRSSAGLDPVDADDLAYVAYHTSMFDIEHTLNQELKETVPLVEKKRQSERLQDAAHRQRQRLQVKMVSYIIDAESFPARLVTKIFTTYPQFLNYGPQTNATRAINMSKIFLRRDPKDIFGIYHRLQRETLELLPYSVVIELDRAKDPVQHALVDVVGKDFASYVTAFF